MNTPVAEVGLSLALGIGLSAACGFRVFLPFLVMSLADHAGYISLAPDWEWIASYPALALFATATLVEVGAYFVPWLDNLLDTVATPAAAVAGTLAVVAVTSNFSPPVAWTIGAISGGGIATSIQLGSVLLRGASTVSSLGATNFLVAGAELIAALATAIFAIVAPVTVTIVIIIVLIILLLRFIF